MNRFFVFIVFFNLVYVLNSQSLEFLSTRQLSLGGASVSIVDEWSGFSNVGASAFIEKSSIGLNYSNRYFLNELHQNDLVGSLKLSKGVLSTGFSYAGFSAFSSTRSCIGYALKLKNNLGLGVQLTHNTSRFSQLALKTDHYFSANVGLYYKVQDNWAIGVSMVNLFGYIKRENDQLSIFKIGTHHILSEKVEAYLEVEKSSARPIQLKAGLEYQPLTNFFFRVGVNGEPLTVSGGFGYLFSKIRLDVAASYHQILGWSPSFSFVYGFKKK